jgi:hypothetical protein
MGNSLCLGHVPRVGHFIYYYYYCYLFDGFIYLCSLDCLFIQVDLSSKHFMEKLDVFVLVCNAFSLFFVVEAMMVDDMRRYEL